MPHCKNTNFFSEIDVFFKNSEDSAIQAMITALKAINMTDKRLGLATYHNASLSSSEKLRNLVSAFSWVQGYIASEWNSGMFFAPQNFSIIPESDFSLAFLGIACMLCLWLIN